MNICYLVVTGQCSMSRGAHTSSLVPRPCSKRVRYVMSEFLVVLNQHIIMQHSIIMVCSCSQIHRARIHQRDCHTIPLSLSEHTDPRLVSNVCILLSLPPACCCHYQWGGAAEHLPYSKRRQTRVTDRRSPRGAAAAGPQQFVVLGPGSRLCHSWPQLLLGV